MTALQQLQKEYTGQLQAVLDIDFEELAGRGVAEYLKNELIKRQLKALSIGKKYGVKTIDELDESLGSGYLQEENVAEDDYIELAELNKEIRAIKALMTKLSYG